MFKKDKKEKLDFKQGLTVIKVTVLLPLLLYKTSSSKNLFRVSLVVDKLGNVKRCMYNISVSLVNASQPKLFVIVTILTSN